jgi:hypothetical protein
MAALNFPSNPSNGDSYVGDNGITYTYDGVKWTSTSSGGGGGSTTLSGLNDVGLDSPADGQILMWVDSQSRWENMDLPTGGVVSQLTNGSNSVSLGDDGNLSMPGNTVVFTPTDTTLRLQSTGSTYGGTSIEFKADPEQETPYSAKVQLDTAGVKINTSGDSCQWTFDYNGNLTLPSIGGDIKTSDGNSILDRISAGGKSASLDSSSHDLMLPNGVVYRYDETVLGGVGTGPDGYTLYSMDAKTINIMAQANGQPVNWQFNGGGEIIFPDGTVQTTAYNYAPQDLVNIDGGIASTQFDVSYAYIDCGGSARRGVLDVDTFDGEDNGAGQTQFDKVLNGGGA